MAVSFNGTADVIDMGSLAAAGSGYNFVNNSPIAMVCWVNFSSLLGTQSFISRGFDGTSTGYFFQTVAGTPPTLTWGSFVSPSTVHGVVWNMAFSTGSWHHVYGDYTGSGTHLWRLYIDGVDVSAGGVSDTTGPIQIGGREFGVGAVDTTGGPGFTQFFSGCMADVALFNGPLTPTEITNLGNGTQRPSSGMSQTLRGYWPLAIAQNPQVDMSGSGNNGIPTGTTTCGTSPPFNVAAVTLMGAICC